MKLIFNVEKTENKPVRTCLLCQVGLWRQLRPVKENVITGHVTSVNYMIRKDFSKG